MKEEVVDIETAVKALDGREYGEEGSKEFFAMMKESGLVAVFGASDDLMELRGAIDDEVGCYDGGTAYLTSAGLFEATCGNEHCPHEREQRRTAARIKAIWDSDGFSWIYETKIPHETFHIFEEGEPYCRGIVFRLSDVQN